MMASAFSPDAIQRACGSLPALETISRPAFHSLSKALPARSFMIDGEAIVTNGDGLAVFDLIRHKRHGRCRGALGL
jgi:hypothetical protein